MGHSAKAGRERGGEWQGLRSSQKVLASGEVRVRAVGENHGDVAAVGSRGNPKRGSIRGAWLCFDHHYGFVREQRARVWEGRCRLVCEPRGVGWEGALPEKIFASNK